MPELNCPKCDAPITYADAGKVVKCANCGADVLACRRGGKIA